MNRSSGPVYYYSFIAFTVLTVFIFSVILLFPFLKCNCFRILFFCPVLWLLLLLKVLYKQYIDLLIDICTCEHDDSKAGKTVCEHQSCIYQSFDRLTLQLDPCMI